MSWVPIPSNRCFEVLDSFLKPHHLGNWSTVCWAEVAIIFAVLTLCACVIHNIRVFIIVLLPLFEHLMSDRQYASILISPHLTPGTRFCGMRWSASRTQRLLQGVPRPIICWNNYTWRIRSLTVGYCPISLPAQHLAYIEFWRDIYISFILRFHPRHLNFRMCDVSALQQVWFRFSLYSSTFCRLPCCSVTAHAVYFFYKSRRPMVRRRRYRTLLLTDSCCRSLTIT